MKIEPKENIPLSSYSTMRLGGPARYLLEITSPFEIEPALKWAEEKNLDVMMIGQGSNIVWNDAGFDGLILVNKIMGLEMQDNEYQAFAVIGGGEPWDSVVARIVDANLSGVEHLSLIPGTAGATPVQNVGAYGREIADVLVCVQAYDRQANKMVILSKTECDFSYRKSRFNTVDKNRFFITSVTLALSHDNPMPPFYPALEAFLKSHNITQHTAKNIRQAVIEVRNSKLPDPAKVANCGSFFANPIIDNMQLDSLVEQYPGIPRWEIDSDNTKISAAWMLEQLKLKGYHEPNTGMAIWDKHSLVLVNENAPNTASLLAFRDAIVKKVEEKFGVTLQQEPELI
ncbi:UDP-N-acetylmuramate dehydrogenase [Candidatus Parcubacteria bacterium]|nr:UDP-N-acetylmuramate dehydrogenase [Candidatus Parcubacteria bacterium]